MILGPEAAEIATLNTCETAIVNLESASDLQICFDDWVRTHTHWNDLISSQTRQLQASLAFQISEACPGDEIVCQSVVNGAFVTEWAIEYVFYTYRTNGLPDAFDRVFSS